MAANLSRLYVGNLPPNVETDDILELFSGFGNILYGELRQKGALPFAFVEFESPADAQNVMAKFDGYKYEGYKLRVGLSRGVGSARVGHGGGANRVSRSRYRLIVNGLPPSGSWQDLKDHTRKLTRDVCFADVYNDGSGIVEFRYYDDMKNAARKLNGSKFRSHENETTYIKVKEDFQFGFRRYSSPSRELHRHKKSSRSRSRSRSMDRR